MARRVVLTLLALIIATGAALGGVWWYRGGTWKASRAPLVLHGTVESFSVDVRAQTGGQVRLIAVREGDTVRAGQLIAWLEASALRAALQDAQQQLRDAQGRLEALRTTHPDNLRDSVARADAEAARAQQALEEAQSLSRETAFLSGRVESAREALDGADSLLKEAETRLSEIQGSSMNTDNPGPLESGSRDAGGVSSNTPQPAQLEGIDTAQSQELSDAVQAVRQARRRRGAAARDLIEAERAYKRATEAAARLPQLSEDADQAAAAAQSARADLESANALQADRSEEESARLAVRDAQAVVASARSRLSNAIVLSPASGVVERLHVTAGVSLTGGESVATLRCSNPVVVQLNLSANDAGDVRRDQKVTARSAAIPGVIFHGKVTEVTDPSATPARTATVKISLDNPNGQLQPEVPLVLSFE